MARSKETFDKRNKEQKRLKRRQDKQLKMDERKGEKKATNLEDMMAYIDENGNISDTPPDPRNKKVYNVDDIQIGIPAGNTRDSTRTGSVNFFNEEKGFGFILEDGSKEKIFLHASNLLEPVGLNDKVKYETQFGERGLVAINVKKR
ncbi:MAG: cold shock domain-containing protein [Chitinophagaceae bacterium]|nr:cold shock domain-containing protein [Chitinophagaceae bacterium]